MICRPPALSSSETESNRHASTVGSEVCVPWGDIVEKNPLFFFFFLAWPKMRLNANVGPMEYNCGRVMITMGN